MNNWNSEQYIKFKNERTRPSEDLIKRLDFVPSSILDIGCGPGNSTDKLHQAFPNADILGIDSSENMLTKAINTYPNLKFRQCIIPNDIDLLESYDLIFSNACLHWIPDHKELLPQLMKKLNSRGKLAVQMPDVKQAPFYRILNEMTLSEKWKKLKNVDIFHNLSPDETYDILSKCSLNVDMWETTYYHIMSSHKDIIEWYKGSGLRPYLDSLDENEQQDFIFELTEKLKAAIPVRSGSNVILKMSRMFFISEIN